MALIIVDSDTQTEVDAPVAEWEIVALVARANHRALEREIRRLILIGGISEKKAQRIATVGGWSPLNGWVQHAMRNATREPEFPPRCLTRSSH